MNSRQKNWCFTINNYTTDDLERLQDLGRRITTDIQYLIIGKEIGEDNQTPHLQCFIQFKKRLRFLQVKNFVGQRAHIEAARGTSGENFVYCSKDGDYEEFGTRTTAGIGLSARRGAYPIWFWADI
jgi:hypothetical protein